MIELPIIDGPDTGGERPGRRFWRSFGELDGEPDFERIRQNEFMPGASDAPSGSSRRQFLQLVGASMAMAGLAACRRPSEMILPYARKPEDVIPGVPLFYATAMPYRGTVRPLLVENHDGRPSKVEGNPDHPSSPAATSPFEQASILNLYDPDRSRAVLRGGAEATWQDFVQAVQRFQVGAASKRVAVLAAETSSPTVRAMRDRLQEQYPQSRWITYRPEGSDPVQLGLQEATGRPLRPRYAFDQAEVVVSLDADFLGPTDVDMVHNTRSWARTRRLEGQQDELGRLYAIDSQYSLTGGMADHRLAARAVDVPAMAASLAARIGLEEAAVLGGAFADHPFLDAAADDLRQAGSAGLVIAGDTQPPEVHALAAAMNAALGSTAVTYLDTGVETVEPLEEQMASLVEDMRAGRVDALLMLDVNPVYSAPAELGFREALASVEETIHAGHFVDETAQLCRWHLPLSHYLEMWGDGRSFDGTLSVIQPMIAPLYGTKSEIEILNTFATGLDEAGYDLVRTQWQNYVTGDFEGQWRQVLHDGYLPDSSYPTADAAGATVPDLSMLPTPDVDELEVVFRLDPTVLDGRFSNNPWMQELPDPTTKIVWDNVALLSPATAERLGVGVEYEEGRFDVSVVELSIGDRSLPIPVWIQPGMPAGSITVTLGYGRDIESPRPERTGRFFDLDTYTDIWARGPIANGVGVNVAPLRTAAFERVFVGAGAAVTGEDYSISTTQEHGAMEGRPIVRMATLEEYRENPDFAEDRVPTLPGGEPWEDYPPLWDERHPTDEPPFKDNLYHRNQWGMTIDLNTCTGCNACIVACTSENNIQMVGKEEVGRGREMHWLRVDRYFVSDEHDVDAAEPRMVVQPVPCMHCENAPCEQVCPVAATSHSPDGINEMTYNRCIGTRYCSNNCPYKVRHFNFFNWTKTMPDTLQMAQNPNVTVRFRGVMEKCTYCVQRVRDVQRQASLESRTVRDGEVMTACQQVCPAEAITFGDISDPDSAVVRQKENARNYEMLAELDVKPRTSYLGRVYNPNPLLETPRNTS